MKLSNKQIAKLSELSLNRLELIELKEASLRRANSLRDLINQERKDINKIDLELSNFEEFKKRYELHKLEISEQTQQNAVAKQNKKAQLVATLEQHQKRLDVLLEEIELTILVASTINDTMTCVCNHAKFAPSKHGIVVDNTYETEVI